MSDQTTWSQVDAYFERRLIPADAALTAALAANAAADLPAIDVAPNQGKLLYLLAKAIKAERILEIGTLGGYSTIWLAKALPENGRIVTLESVAAHAKVAQNNINQAGFAEQVDIRVDYAINTLPQLTDLPPFDFIFVDADKVSNADYFQWALRLSRPGSLILFDNVVRDGKVADERSTNANVQGVHKLHNLIEAEPRVTATAIQTVGSKGYDGFTLIFVQE